MKLNLREHLRLYFIMGSNNTEMEPEKVLKQAIDGGITMFQFREKGDGSLVGNEKKKLAKLLMHICRENRIPFIVNDDIELALELDADGIHIGQDDFPANEARRMLGNKILGVSVHTLDEANQAIEAGTDYFGVGPIYGTSTKTDALPPAGVGFIKELRSQGIDLPIVGIGGIDSNNAAAVIEAGADGVSIISAISTKKNPEEAAQRILNEMNSN
ncbi:thiamine phosphate synthase [Bacillus massilinigeriensis]|uniref:thiamine phosphate synthase n=1 Tax=Bacillus mediterraneensis TaxID=1805474 RepID=UPI0008F91886|nr:thiamine phosphate synthase [Bacillus mediterraneensis]